MFNHKSRFSFQNQKWLPSVITVQRSFLCHVTKVKCMNSAIVVWILFRNYKFKIVCVTKKKLCLNGTIFSPISNILCLTNQNLWQSYLINHPDSDLIQIHTLSRLVSNIFDGLIQRHVFFVGYNY